MNKENNNEGERAAEEYVDTTLRSSHYNQTQRIEDATDANSRKLSTLQKIILSSIICIIATYLGTGYIIYKHGSVLFSGDSIEGLRNQIETNEVNAAKRHEANRMVAKRHRENRDDVEAGLRDQIDKLNADLEAEKNYRIRVEQQIEGLKLQLGTLVDILRANEDEEVVTKKNLDNSALHESN
tara:strand:+ start:6220 stop:6768 length:549 start_codon:yes stop_codon:yes gene_type:complete